MITLYNGRGQLGLELIKYIDLDIECDIYHTWNFSDKSFETQKLEFKKYSNYLNKVNKNKSFYFISTKSTSPDDYVFFKNIAEQKTLEFGGSVIKIPNLIGKGFCDKLLNYEEPFGNVEINGYTMPAYIIKEILLY